jgi:hypothetical protein
MMDGMQHALSMQPVAREEAPAPRPVSRPRAHMNTHRYDVLLSAILKSLEFRINSIDIYMFQAKPDVPEKAYLSHFCLTKAGCPSIPDVQAKSLQALQNAPHDLSFVFSMNGTGLLQWDFLIVAREEYIAAHRSKMPWVVFGLALAGSAWPWALLLYQRRSMMQGASGHFGAFCPDVCAPPTLGPRNVRVKSRLVPVSCHFPALLSGKRSWWTRLWWGDDLENKMSPKRLSSMLGRRRSLAEAANVFVKSHQGGSYQSSASSTPVASPLPLSVHRAMPLDGSDEAAGVGVEIREDERLPHIAAAAAGCEVDLDEADSRC